MMQTAKHGWLIALALAAGMLVSSTADAQRRGKRGKRPAKPERSDKAEPTEVAAGDEAGDDAGGESNERVIDIGSKERTSKGGKEKLFDFDGLNFDGSTRMPSLLYFLDRANEELQQASLERRSFVPEMVRSVEEEEL
jgi:hypothetical protein